MDCAAILKRLSEYIDGTLDAQTRTWVEKHIAVCENCKQELASLRAVVEQLGALEPVEPPADFLEKIHERMEARSGFSKVFRKLFVPLHIKIPLELAAAATVSILVVLVLNIQQPGIQMMKIPVAPTSQSMAKKSKEDFIKPAFKKEAGRPVRVFEEAPAKLSDSEPVMLARRSGAKSVAPSIQMESEPKLSVLTKEKVSQSAGKNHSIELSLVLKTGVIGGAYKPGIAMQAAPPPESDESLVEEKSAHTDFFEREIDAGEKDRTADLLPRMKYIIGLVKGKVLTVEYDRQAERLKSIFAEIPAKNYKSFCRKLTGIGTFQSTPPDLSDKDLGMIQVRVRFLSD
jgi:Putative zinc-finger